MHSSMAQIKRKRLIKWMVKDYDYVAIGGIVKRNKTEENIRGFLSGF